MVLYKILKPEFSKVKVETVRSLTGEEQQLLQSYVGVISKIEHPFLLMAAVLFFFVNAIILFLIKAYIVAVAWLLLGLLVLKYNFPKLNKNYYALDLTSPVLKIEGKVYRSLAVGLKFYQMLILRSLGASSRIWDFKVGRYAFKAEVMTPSCQESFEAIKEGDVISVEFSPHTKFVWKLTRL